MSFEFEILQIVQKVNIKKIIYNIPNISIFFYSVTKEKHLKKNKRENGGEGGGWRGGEKREKLSR